MATWEQIKELCDDAIHYQTASVCIPAAYVKQAKEYVGDAMRVCTVIGFPNGYSTTAVKVFETQDAVQNGADEIDMVINIGWVKETGLRRAYPEGDCGDLPPHRGGKNPDVRGRHTLRRGLY